MVQRCQDVTSPRKVISHVDQVNSVLKRGVKKGYHTGKEEIFIESDANIIARFSA